VSASQYSYVISPLGFNIDKVECSGQFIANHLGHWWNLKARKCNVYYYECLYFKQESNGTLIASDWTRYVLLATFPEVDIFDVVSCLKWKESIFR
jgi:hypothetical protein